MSGSQVSSAVISFPRSGAVGLDGVPVYGLRVREESGSHDLIQVEYRAEPKYIQRSLGDNAPITVSISSPRSGARTWWGYVDTVRATPETTESRAGSIITAFGLTRSLSSSGSRAVKGSAHAAITEIAASKGLSVILLGNDAQVDQYQGDRSDWQLINALASSCGARVSTKGARIIVAPVRDLFDRAGAASPRIGLSNEPGLFDQVVEESYSRASEELPSRVFTRGAGNLHARGGWFGYVEGRGWGWVHSVDHRCQNGEHTMEVMLHTSDWLRTVRAPGDPQAPTGPLMPQYVPRLVKGEARNSYRWVL